MPHRNAASVLPEPVGARTSVWSPEAIAGQPCSCAAEGAAKLASNQALTAGEKRSRAMAVKLPRGCDSRADRPGRHRRAEKPEGARLDRAPSGKSQGGGAGGRTG